MTTYPKFESRRLSMPVQNGMRRDYDGNFLTIGHNERTV